MSDSSCDVVLSHTLRKRKISVKKMVCTIGTIVQNNVTFLFLYKLIFSATCNRRKIQVCVNENNCLFRVAVIKENYNLSQKYVNF